METHANHLHHAPGKKFWHYFFEFFMLFLAVFAGFLAENWREHVVEKERETQFMRSMIEDLKSDSTYLAANIRLRRERNTMIDSLIFLLSTPNYQQNLDAIYYYGRSISPPLNFFPNDRTIQQLKSSGGLRLIHNIQVSNNIMAYDQKMRMQLFELTDEVEIRSEYRQLARKIFDGKVFNSMINDNRIDRPFNNPLLLKSDKETLNEFIGQLQYIKKSDQSQLLRASELSKQAAELISMIKKEYSLK